MDDLLIDCDVEQEEVASDERAAEWFGSDEDEHGSHVESEGPLTADAANFDAERCLCPEGRSVYDAKQRKLVASGTNAGLAPSFAFMEMFSGAYPATLTTRWLAPTDSPSLRSAYCVSQGRARPVALRVLRRVRGVRAVRRHGSRSASRPALSPGRQQDESDPHHLVARVRR